MSTPGTPMEDGTLAGVPEPKEKHSVAEATETEENSSCSGFSPNAWKTPAYYESFVA